MVRFWGGLAEWKIPTNFLKIGCQIFPSKNVGFPSKTEILVVLGQKSTPHLKWRSTFVTRPISWEFVLEVREDLNFAVWGSENFFGWGEIFFWSGVVTWSTMHYMWCFSTTPERPAPDFQKFSANFRLDQSAPKSFHSFPGTYIFRKNESGTDPPTRKFKILV